MEAQLRAEILKLRQERDAALAELEELKSSRFIIVPAIPTDPKVDAILDRAMAEKSGCKKRNLLPKKALVMLRKELAKSDGPFIARNLTNWFDLSEAEILATLVELCEETTMIECEGCGTLCDVPGNDEDESRETRRYNRSCTSCSQPLGTSTVRVFRGRK